MSNVSTRKKGCSRTKIKSMGDHKEFLKRITKTLYYGQLPSLPCLSLPVTEISCAAWSASQRGRSLRRLHADAAARLARGACVSPCALVLALLYLERLNNCNPHYLANAAPADLFLVSLMVGNKFLQDDGEDDEVFCSEWAESGGMDLKQLKKLEIEFLNAIDWNVFVSEDAFEEGLRRLERQVALRQGALRGFYTYSDACAAGAAGALGSVARALAAAGLLYACAAAALLTLCHAALPPPPPTTAPAATSPPPLYNDTVYTRLTITDSQHLADQLSDPLKCCPQWRRYQDVTEKTGSWYDSVVMNDWKTLEPWWTKSSSASLLWLYQSSLVDPIQRWLEMMTEYAELVREVVMADRKPAQRCYGYVENKERQHCVRQFLNLSKLSGFVASQSDR